MRVIYHSVTNMKAQLQLARRGAIGANRRRLGGTPESGAISCCTDPVGQTVCHTMSVVCVVTQRELIGLDSSPESYHDRMPCGVAASDVEVGVAVKSFAGRRHLVPTAHRIAAERIALFRTSENNGYERLADARSARFSARAVTARHVESASTARGSHGASCAAGLRGARCAGAFTITASARRRTRSMRIPVTREHNPCEKSRGSKRH
jgi:hypothetical protein